MTRHPFLTFVIGIGGGILALLAIGFVVSAGWSRELAAISVAVIFLLVALISSFAVTIRAWVLTLLVLAPGASLLLLSLAFSGQFDAFVRHDLVPSIAAIIGTGLGSAIGTRLRQRFRHTI